MIERLPWRWFVLALALIYLVVLVSALAMLSHLDGWGWFMQRVE